MKKRKETPAKAKTIVPEMDWQTGDYTRHQEFSFTLPYQFLLLCKLMDVTPRQMLLDFMDNLSCSSWNREGRNGAKEKLIEYFIEHQYGQDYYSTDDIKQIFRELDAIGMLYPRQAAEEMINTHCQWRKEYHLYWFNHWYNKYRRK